MREVDFILKEKRILAFQILLVWEEWVQSDPRKKARHNDRNEVDLYLASTISWNILKDVTQTSSPSEISSVYPDDTVAERRRMPFFLLLGAFRFEALEAPDAEVSCFGI